MADEPMWPLQQMHDPSACIILNYIQNISWLSSLYTKDSFVIKPTTAESIYTILYYLHTFWSWIGRGISEMARTSTIKCTNTYEQAYAQPVGMSRTAQTTHFLYHLIKYFACEWLAVKSITFSQVNILSQISVVFHLHDTLAGHFPGNTENWWLRALGMCIWTAFIPSQTSYNYTANLNFVLLSQLWLKFHVCRST